jgi:hypothetical protein
MLVASVPLVADADEFFKPFRTVLSKPQYAHFYRLVLSLMVCLQAHRVTDALRLWQYVRHWTNVYGFLRSQAWCVLEVARSLWKVVQEFLGHPLRLYAVVDDTTVRHAGAKKMEAVRSHHNASSQNDPCRARKVWGHQWVVVGLGVMTSALSWEILPITASLVEGGMSKLELTPKMFLAPHLGESVILTMIADGWYTKRPLVSGLRERQIHYLGKIRRDARLFEPLPERAQSGKRKRGRPRTKGPRVDLELLIQQQPAFSSLEVVIRGRKRFVDLWSRVVVVRGWGGMKARVVVVRWKLKSGRSRFLFLLCTDPGLSALDVVREYDRRWMIEPCFCDLKQRGGFSAYSGRRAKGHSAWAQLCCVARTLLVLLTLKRKGGIIDPWHRSTQPDYSTVGQKRLEITSVFGHFARVAENGNNSAHSGTIKCQITKNR